MSGPVPRRAAPRYREIAAYLRSRLPVDGRMPTEAELCRRFSCSRFTARAAYELLRGEGLVDRRPGRGTLATPTAGAQLSNDLGAWASFRSEQLRRGRQVRLLSARLRVAQADRDVAAALLVGARTQLTLVERVYGIDQEPAVWFRSWLHPCTQVGIAADPRQPLYQLIAACGGPRPAHSEEDIAAVGADAPTARMLGLRRGAAVLVRRRIVRDAAGSAFEVNLGTYRTDRCRLTTGQDGAAP